MTKILLELFSMTETQKFCALHLFILFVLCFHLNLRVLAKKKFFEMCLVCKKKTSSIRYQNISCTFQLAFNSSLKFKMLQFRHGLNITDKDKKDL